MSSKGLHFHLWIWFIELCYCTFNYFATLDLFLGILLSFLQHCAYCKRLGASIKCCAEGCVQLYHYPCAGAAGTFQDIRSLSLLCPEHIELAINKCKFGQILCREMDKSVKLEIWLIYSVILYSLIFLFCFVFLFFLSIVADDVNCVLCDSPGDLLDQLFCTSCGLHYHGMCLDMAVTPLRRAGWQCPECKVCQTCKWVTLNTHLNKVS